MIDHLANPPLGYLALLTMHYALYTIHYALASQNN